MKQRGDMFFNAAKEAGFDIKQLGEFFGRCVFAPPRHPLHVTPELARFTDNIFELIDLYGLEYVRTRMGKPAEDDAFKK
jgi:hypothetical protein